MTCKKGTRVSVSNQSTDGDDDAKAFSPVWYGRVRNSYIPMTNALKKAPMTRADPRSVSQFICPIFVLIFFFYFFLFFSMFAAVATRRV